MSSNDTGASMDAPAPRKRGGFILVLFILCLGVVAGIALGVWQIYRLQWKTDLIARVNERAYHAPVAAPGPDDWAGLTEDNAEYTSVQVTGHYLDAPAVLVQAVTDFGSGFWVMSPFETERDFTVLINRGFVMREERADFLGKAPDTQETDTVKGLLRMTQPDGAFLRDNDPEGGWWYSRDVDAIAQVQGVGEVAPYFIDRIDDDGNIGPPMGGLTQLVFPNSHLVYVITWFGLSLMCLGGAVFLVRARLHGRDKDGEEA